MGWLWSGLGWGLLAAGLGLLMWALFWDRAGWRGRAGLRCRGCWYDLTGAAGVLEVSRGSPVVCPECGRGHRSVRGMRKTRRRWGWTVVGLVVLVMGYGARTVPRVQQKGWGSAVPRVLLVLSLPLLSDEQGSGLGDFVIPPRSENATWLDRFVLAQVPSGDGMYYLPVSNPAQSEFGWLSRRLVFAIARFQDPDVLTDGTTARGRAMKSLVSQFVSSGRCYGFERDWAKQQVTIEIDIQHDFGPDETPIGQVRMRRLLLGPYRVRFGEDSTMYRGGSPTSMRINGFHSMMDTAEAERAHWVNRFLWDDLQPVEQSWGDRRDAYVPGVFLSKGTDRGDGVALAGEQFVFFGYIGEDWRGFNDDAMWELDFFRREEIRYRLNPKRVIVADSSIALEDAIEGAFAARLGVEYEQTRDRWVPVVTIAERAGASPVEGNIVLGGYLVVVAIDPGKPESRGTEYLRDRGETFWAWGRERYLEGVPPRGSASTPPERATVAKQTLRVRNRFTGHLPGELTSNQWALRNRRPSERTVVLRMTYQHHPQAFGFGGLWGDRVYEGVLEFDIPDWTVEDLRQFMVNGIVPEHAMP